MSRSAPGATATSWPVDPEMRRLCPHCGSKIYLDRCAVVATNRRPTHDGAQHLVGGAGAPTAAAPDFDAPGGRPDPRQPAHTSSSASASAAAAAAASEPPARTVDLRTLIGGRPMLWRPTAPAAPAAPPSSRGSGGWLRQLSGTVVAAAGPLAPPLRSLTDFEPALLARRACTACTQPLPRELDEREAHILAVVGLNGAGKTHYLASALTQATRQRGLAPLGFTEFSPDEATANVFHQRYYTHLFREGEMFVATPAEVGGYDPMVFRVTREDHQPLLLMTHDVSGEVLADFRTRASVTPFLRRASAVIFLVDPLEFDFVRERMPRGSLPPARSIHQADLLGACLDELQYEFGEDQVPVAVVVSKADILPHLFGQEFAFAQPADQEHWIDDIRARSREVRDFLLRLGETELVTTAERHSHVTFHAASALGAMPTETTIIPAPVRCLDPLAVVLIRLMAAVG